MTDYIQIKQRVRPHTCFISSLYFSLFDICISQMGTRPLGIEPRAFTSEELRATTALKRPNYKLTERAASIETKIVVQIIMYKILYVITINQIHSITVI